MSQCSTSRMTRLVPMLVTVLGMGTTGCAQDSGTRAELRHDTAGVQEEVETAVWAFHAADTSRDAEAVIDLVMLRELCAAAWFTRLCNRAKPLWQHVCASGA